MLSTLLYLGFKTALSPNLSKLLLSRCFTCKQELKQHNHLTQKKAPPLAFLAYPPKTRQEHFAK